MTPRPPLSGLSPVLLFVLQCLLCVVCAPSPPPQAQASPPPPQHLPPTEWRQGLIEEWFVDSARGASSPMLIRQVPNADEARLSELVEGVGNLDNVQLSVHTPDDDSDELPSCTFTQFSASRPLVAVNASLRARHEWADGVDTRSLLTPGPDAPCA